MLFKLTWLLCIPKALICVSRKSKVAFITYATYVHAITLAVAPQLASFLQALWCEAGTSRAFTYSLNGLNASTSLSIQLLHGWWVALLHKQAFLVPDKSIATYHVAAWELCGSLYQHSCLR
jgi:hypothetical protein